MRKILLAVNDLTEAHLRRIHAATAGWAEVDHLDQNAAPDVYQQHLANAEVVIGWPKPEWLLAAAAPRLFLLPSVGYDNYAQAGLGRKTGLTICNARGAITIQVAEHCVAMMCALTRRLHHHRSDQMEERWVSHAPYDELTGETVCLLGLGAIGQAIAARCRGLGMRVIGVARRALILPDVEEVFSFERLHAALAQARHVAAALPAAPETENLCDEAFFSAMPRGSYFYNVGRGSLVDEAALLAALRGGQLAGAGLDVMQTEPLPAGHPFWSEPNLLLTPHIAGRSVREFDRMCDLLVENLERYARGEALKNQITLG
jgi:phosphoglycerate dehydrogenase-like enzyme